MSVAKLSFLPHIIMYLIRLFMNCVIFVIT